MSVETVGMWSINISFVIYCVYFLPQIIFNQLKHQAASISYGTQSLMVLANLLDLIYGFGFDLQWQYKAVTILTLSCLLFQQWQMYRDAKHKSYKFHVCILSLYLLVIILISLHALNATILEKIGFISMACYAIYWLPQIIKNYQLKSAKGFSFWFIVLNMIALSCDEVSAIAFGWPLPSLISPIVILSFLFIMLAQVIYYRNQTNKQLAW